MRRIASLLPVVGVPLVFGGVLANGWVNWDDPLHVLDNPWLERISWGDVARFWREPYRGLFVPVSYMAFAAETAAGRAVSGSATPAAVVFHAVSLALHMACVGLVIRLLGQLGSSPWAVAAGAAVFAVHPLQVESVAWISEQRGLLAALGTLVAVTAVTSGSSRSAGWPRRAAVATLAFVLAVLSKPSAVVAPLLAAAIAATSPADDKRLRCRRFLSLIGLWVALGLIATAATRAIQIVAADAAVPLALRPLVAADAVAFYAGKLVAPFGLCIDYGRTPAVVVADPWAIGRAVTVALVAVVAIAAWVVKPRYRAALVPPLLAIGALAPVLGFVPFAFQEISTVADRYAYLAMLGPAVGIAAGVDAAASSGRRWPARLVAAGVAAVVVGWAAISMRQVPAWHDSLALGQRALTVNGGTRDTLNNLGLALHDRGRDDEAAACFEAAIARDPAFPPARFNLGLACHRSGRLADAERHYREAIRLRPRYAIAHNNLGIVLAQLGRAAEAEGAFRAAIDLDPADRDARANLDRLRHDRAAGE